MIKGLLILAIMLTPVTVVAKSITLDKKRTVEVIGVVDGGIIKKAQEVLKLATPKAKKKKDIWVLVNSPGGQVTPGLVFNNALDTARHRGYKVNCAVGLLAASMGFQILAHCSQIYALNNAKLLYHPVTISGRFNRPQLQYYHDSIFILEETMNKELLDYFDFDKDIFYRNYKAETMWEAYDLARLTDRIEIVDDILGTKNALTIRRQQSFMFNFLGISYIMSDDYLDRYYIGVK